jgi:2-oxoglutarate dehydrogenase E2 component (dihydrolipoamide succinyltransferase)
MSGAHEILMPALGMAMEEGTLLRWLKQPGEHVAPAEPVAEIETDKVTMEIESPVAGRLGEHLFAEGAVVPVGTAIVRVEPDGAQAAPVAAPERPKPPPAAARRPKRRAPPPGGERYVRLVPEEEGDGLLGLDLTGVYE